MSRRLQVKADDRYGHLTIINELERHRSPSGGTHRRVSCKCDCGKEVVRRLDHLASGATTSCGCWWGKRHGYCAGGSIDPTYQSWGSMRSRCYSTSNTRYSDYGGRGLTVCDRWAVFECFLEDMGNRPDGTSIDRIDNDGNYEPDNCRWATRKQQQRNRHNNRLVTFNGDTRCVSEWAELLGINRSTLSKRLDRGWSVARALTTPGGR